MVFQDPFEKYINIEQTYKYLTSFEMMGSDAIQNRLRISIRTGLVKVCQT